MRRRRIYRARSRASKRAYRKRQRQQALGELGGALASLIPGVGLAKTAHDAAKAYDKFRRNW